MAISRLRALLDPLPWALRVEVGGYVRSVEAVHRNIYRDADLSTKDVPLDAFLFFAGLWRLWTLVDGQHWIVQNTVRLAEQVGIGRIRAGAAVYSRRSEDAMELELLRRDLRQTLARNDIDFLLRQDGPESILRALDAEGIRDGRR